MTGLRYSDIANLKWNDIEHIKGQGYVLEFSQQKTKGVETLPISEQAYSFCGTPCNPNVFVFEGLLKLKNKLGLPLKNWLAEADITKHITFHCFRHTYATLQLFMGTDIYTVSKLLGHKNLKTTQIYTKIVDEKKREASNKIKLDI